LRHLIRLVLALRTMVIASMAPMTAGNTQWLGLSRLK